MATDNRSSSRHGHGHRAAYSPHDRGPRPNSVVINMGDSHYPTPYPSSASVRYDPWELFEERLRSGPFILPRRLVPMHPSHPFLVTMDEEEFWRYGEAMSPALQRFVRASPLRFSDSFHDDNGGRNLTPAEVDTALKKIETEVYKPPSPKAVKGNKDKDKGENDPNVHTCSICLEDFFAKEQIQRLPCNHRFHLECLTPWVKSQGQCPLCRLDLTGRPPTANNNEHNANANANAGQVPPNANGNANPADEMALLIRAMEDAFASLAPHLR